VRQVLLAAAASHRDVLSNPTAKVEFVEVGLGSLRFQLHVWSTEHLKTAGTLKSDLNFEVWRQFAAAGVTVAPVNGPIALGLQLVPTAKQ
jgi:potassium-dependent mechanosensitive channel